MRWLNFNQFADKDGFTASLTQLNKLSRELSTESVDTFVSLICADSLTEQRTGHSVDPVSSLFNLSGQKLEYAVVKGRRLIDMHPMPCALNRN